VLPVNYRLHEGSIVFRTSHGSPMDEDLRTGSSHADYQVAFQVDEIKAGTRGGLERSSADVPGSRGHCP